MTAFGALDLYSGSNSLTGTNLWQSDKNPLNQITEGVDDVIGKQANNATTGIASGFQLVINAILGIPLSLLPDNLGNGVITQLDSYFTDLENFFGELLSAFGLEDLTNGDIGGLLGELLNIPVNFINELLGLFGLGNLNGVEGEITQLAGQLFQALSAIPADLEGFVTNVEAIFGDLNFLSPSFNPQAALEEFIQDTIGATGLLPILQDGVIALENIPTDLGIENIPILGTLYDIVNDIAALLGDPSGLGSGNPLLTDIGNIPIVGPIVDLIYNSLTGNNANGITFGNLGGEISQLATDVETALTNAASSFNITQTFGGLLHQVVADLENNPIYQGAEDFINQIEGVVNSVWNNILNALSPQNPGTVQTNSQVQYILAHLDPTTSNYRYIFDPSTLLSANYPGPPPTSSPAFTAPTGWPLPTVPSGASYIYNYPTSIGVATGNPANSGTDHSVITDRYHVEMTIEAFSNGSSEFFCNGNGTTGLGQHVAVRIDYQAYNPWSYDSALHIITYTGPMSGAVARWSLDMGQSIKVNDVIAIEYDNAGNYTVFQNGTSVTAGVTWADSGNAMTHGAGYREIGCKSNVTNNNPGFFFGGGAGPGLGKLVAYDF